MGIQNQGSPYVLVIMTNSDVYYLNHGQAERLVREIKAKEELFEAVDAKFGSELGLKIDNISSIVKGGNRNA